MTGAPFQGLCRRPSTQSGNSPDVSRCSSESGTARDQEARARPRWRLGEAALAGGAVQKPEETPAFPRAPLSLLHPLAKRPQRTGLSLRRRAGEMLSIWRRLCRDDACTRLVRGGRLARRAISFLPGQSRVRLPSPRPAGSDWGATGASFPGEHGRRGWRMAGSPQL